jgi:hypothetical protein
MRLHLLLIPSAFIFNFAVAQNGSASLSTAQATVTAPVSPASSTPVVPATPETPAPVSIPAAEEERTAIIDYKSVYEATTVEEEVKLAAERFGLSASQQDMWLQAATDRRLTEKQVREKLDSKADFDRDGVYRGLRASQNTFHETIMGYLNPTQKQSFETDRLILQEKQKRLAKMPPPPPPAPTVTVPAVDSAAIKASEEPKAKGKKSKKKKKAVSQ